MQPLKLSLNEEMSKSGKEVSQEMKAKQQALLDSLSLEQYVTPTLPVIIMHLSSTAGALLYLGMPLADRMRSGRKRCGQAVFPRPSASRAINQLPTETKTETPATRERTKNTTTKGANHRAVRRKSARRTIHNLT